MSPKDLRGLKVGCRERREGWPEEGNPASAFDTVVAQFISLYVGNLCKCVFEEIFL